MHGIIAAAWPLLLGMCLLMFGAGLQGTLIGLRATLEGFPTAITGIVMACYYLGFLGGTVAAPHFLQRVGHIRVFTAFTSVASVTILLQGMFVNAWVWGLLRAASGVCFAVIYVIAESWLNDRATSRNRGSLLALYMLVLYVGLGLSQFLLNLADPLGQTLFMLASVLISVALVPMALSVQRAPEIVAPQKVHYRDLYRYSPLGFVAIVFSGMISGTIFSIGPVYARLQGLNTADVATFMSVSILAGVVTQFPIGKLSDRWDRRTVIAAVCIVATLVAATVVVFHELPRGALMLLAATFAGLTLTLYSLAVSHINDQLHPAQMVAASSAIILVNGMGAALGPILTGALMTPLGAQAYFIVLGSLTAGLMLFDLWRKSRARPVPAEHKGQFIGAQPQAVAGQIIASAAREQGTSAAPPR